VREQIREQQEELEEHRRLLHPASPPRPSFLPFNLLGRLSQWRQRGGQKEKKEGFGKREQSQNSCGGGEEEEADQKRAARGVEGGGSCWELSPCRRNKYFTAAAKDTERTILGIYNLEETASLRFWRRYRFAIFICRGKAQCACRNTALALAVARERCRHFFHRPEYDGYEDRCTCCRCERRRDRLEFLLRCNCSYKYLNYRLNVLADRFVWVWWHLHLSEGAQTRLLESLWKVQRIREDEKERHSIIDEEFYKLAISSYNSSHGRSRREREEFAREAGKVRRGLKSLRPSQLYNAACCCRDIDVRTPPHRQDCRGYAYTFANRVEEMIRVEVKSRCGFDRDDVAFRSFPFDVYEEMNEAEKVPSPSSVSAAGTTEEEAAAAAAKQQAVPDAILRQYRRLMQEHTKGVRRH
jgi:hypothetical protein